MELELLTAVQFSQHDMSVDFHVGAIAEAHCRVAVAGVAEGANVGTDQQERARLLPYTGSIGFP